MSSVWLVAMMSLSAITTLSRLADIGPAPPTILVNSSGKLFDLTSLKGKVVIVSFVYTTCNGTCPATTLTLSRVQKVLRQAKLWGTSVEFVSISLDPERDTPDVLKRYAELFVRRGGRLLVGDAAGLCPSAGLWTVKTEELEVQARNVVIALGPQSASLARRFGHSLPLLMKRGYHRHYRMDDAMPFHAVADQERGFVMSPMTRGLRLTTGVEFAGPDAPPNPRQLKHAEAAAALLLPLGAPIEETPWIGVRPCPPDMRPIIGPASGTKGLWFNFGHAHHGLTIGPATGRLLAEMLMGKETFADPTPYRPERFS